MPIAPIATLSIEPFVFPVSVLLDLGMSVNCSYHVITSSLLWWLPLLLEWSQPCNLKLWVRRQWCTFCYIQFCWPYHVV